MKGRHIYTEVQANTNEDSSELVLQHIGLVHRVANHLKARLPDHVELDELVQIGMLGLLEATKNFDSTQGVELSTFASKRIRGAILDEIRRRSPLSRSDNASVKSEQDAIEKLSHLHSREPSASEIAEELGTSVSDYHDRRYKRHSQLTASIDDLESSGTTLLIDDYSPERALEDSNLSVELAEAIALLPERDQLVLSLYYTEEMNLKEIGTILDVSESRISQILSKTTKALRRHIQY